MSYFSNLSRRKFIWGITCTCGTSLFLPSCTDVAMSDRKQFNILSDDFLYSKTFPAYENFKSQTKLITNTSEYNNTIYHNPQRYDDQYWWKKNDIEFWKCIYNKQLGNKILELGPEKVAAFIAEPVMASGGCIVHPENYLKDYFQQFLD